MYSVLLLGPTASGSMRGKTFGSSDTLMNSKTTSTGRYDRTVKPGGLTMVCSFCEFIPLRHVFLLLQAVALAH